MYGENLSAMRTDTISSSTLKKCHNALAYHRVCSVPLTCLVLLLTTKRIETNHQLS